VSRCLIISCIVFLGNRYAYAVASALHGVGNILHKEFMIQVWSSVDYIMFFLNCKFFFELLIISCRHLYQEAVQFLLR
jgi:hypothetical protein